MGRDPGLGIIFLVGAGVSFLLIIGLIVLEILNRKNILPAFKDEV